MARSTATVAEIRQWLIGQTAAFLERAVEDIEPEVELVHYGITSLDKVELGEAIHDEFGVELGDDFLWEYPAIEHAAKRLHELLERP